jgi:hypothetical protein
MAYDLLIGPGRFAHVFDPEQGASGWHFWVKTSRNERLDIDATGAYRYTPYAHPSGTPRSRTTSLLRRHLRRRHHQP